MWSRAAWREAAITGVGTLPMRTVSRHVHGQQCCSTTPCVFDTGHVAALIERPRAQQQNAALCHRRFDSGESRAITFVSGREPILPIHLSVLWYHSGIWVLWAMIGGGEKRR